MAIYSKRSQAHGKRVNAMFNVFHFFVLLLLCDGSSLSELVSVIFTSLNATNVMNLSLAVTISLYHQPQKNASNFVFFLWLLLLRLNILIDH